MMKLAPLSLSNICLLFLEVKAVINDNFKIIFTHHGAPTPQTFSLKVQFHGALFLKIKMFKNIWSKYWLFSLPVATSNIFHPSLATKTSSYSIASSSKNYFTCIYGIILRKRRID